MTKNRTSISVDDEVADYLSQDSVNASGLINDLVKRHLSADGSDKKMLELRIQQVESELSSLETQADQKRDELEELRSRLEEFETGEENILDKAEETFTQQMLEPDNPAVEKWAADAGMSIPDFIEAMEDRLD